jgi:hypothetical protein
LKQNKFLFYSLALAYTTDIIVVVLIVVVVVAIVEVDDPCIVGRACIGSRTPIIVRDGINALFLLASTQMAWR